MDKDRKEEAVPVEVAALGRGGIEAVLRLSSNLEAEREVQVFAEAPRRVTQLLVEEGDPVRKGQLLVQLQDEEQKSAVAKAEIERLRNLIPGRPPTDTTPKPAPPPPDAREAFKHYLDLARRGDGSAALKVGELYEAGRGVAASNNWAYAWYSVAERCGVTAAKSKKDAVANRLQPVEIRQADKLAESQADCKK